jgi:transposase-like protein
MPRRYPAEVRHQVIELARSGTKVAQLAATFGMSDATIYNWLKQDGIDRGESPGLSTEEALDLAAAKHLQVYLDEFVFRHNRRRTPMAGFQTLLGLSTSHRPTTYEEITANEAA